MKVNPIDDKWLWKGRGRKCSPEGNELRDKSLKELQCPECGSSDLFNKPVDDDSLNHLYDPEYYVVKCGCCGWTCPVEPLEDVGEVVAAFKEWLEAWYLMGRPMAFLTCDCTRFFHSNENKLLMMIAADDVVKQCEEEARLINAVRSIVYEAKSKLGIEKYTAVMRDIVMTEAMRNDAK